MTTLVARETLIAYPPEKAIAYRIPNPLQSIVTPLALTLKQVSLALKLVVKSTSPVTSPHIEPLASACVPSSPEVPRISEVPKAPPVSVIPEPEEVVGLEAVGVELGVASVKLVVELEVKLSDKVELESLRKVVLSSNKGSEITVLLVTSSIIISMPNSAPVIPPAPIFSIFSKRIDPPRIMKSAKTTKREFFKSFCDLFFWFIFVFH